MIIDFIKFLKDRKFRQKEEEDILYPPPPEIDFKDIKHNFSKRTYSFKYYQKQLKDTNPRLLHWIGSIDYSGYVRESSLEYLIKNYQTGDENRILLRLEDWVEQIQIIAKKWLIENFNKLSLEQINEQHRVILYLARKKNLSNDHALSIINQHLVSKSSETNDSTFYKLDPKLRKYIYGLEVELLKFRNRILNDRDPFNRIILLDRFAYHDLSVDELEKLQKDKSSFVQRKFLYFQLNNQITPSQEYLISLSLNNNKGLRELANFYLNKIYAINSYDLYNKLEDHRRYFIADYAKKEDLDVFLKGFNTKNQRVKTLCFKAICEIDNSIIKSFDIKELLSSNRIIRKLSCVHFPKLFSLAELLKLQPVIVKVSPKGQLTYLNMIYSKSIWQFIDSALQTLIGNSSEEYVKFVLNKYHKKPYIYEKLDVELKESIMKNISILNGNKNHYIESFIKHLKFTIKSAQPVTKR
jgi:hypothetical protein